MNLPSLTSSLSRFSYGSRIRPVRDWVALIILSLVVLAVFAVLAEWQYLEGAEADALSLPPLPPETVSPDTLAETEAMFDQRAAEALRYQSEYVFVDPSL